MFYRDGLGLESPGVTGTRFEGDDSNPAGAVVMFRLERGLILALYPRSELAKDAECRTPPGRRWEGIATPGSTRRSPSVVS